MGLGGADRLFAVRGLGDDIEAEFAEDALEQQANRTVVIDDDGIAFASFWRCPFAAGGGGGIVGAVSLAAGFGDLAKLVKNLFLPEGFAQEAGGTGIGSPLFDGAVFGGGDEEHVDVGKLGVDVLEDIEAIAARQLVIKTDDARAMAAHGVHDGIAVFQRTDHLIALTAKQCGQQGAHRGIVINDQDLHGFNLPQSRRHAGSRACCVALILAAIRQRCSCCSDKHPGYPGRL